MQQPADMPPFSPAGWRGPAGAPSPISSRPPAPAPGQQHQHQHQQQQQMDEHGAAVSGSGSGSVDGGEEGERGGSSSAGGNRWPRQETLALLKIRSEMDAAFREAALKGPLWEQVSRRLAEMGHTRSAKKCREKFENVDKYYRRTKDGRTGRGDGKTYRFFTELEALHGAHHPPPASVAAPAATIVAYSSVPSAPPRVLAEPSEPSPPPLLLTHQPAQPVPTEAAACLTTTTTVGDASFSDSDGEDTDETADGGKRKRRGGSWGHGGKAMRFFEGLMRQVMERQEAMQNRLLEAIERRDQDRMIREEAWRRQEVARLAREQDALAQERAVAASRDAAVVSFIQRITGQIVPVQAPTSYPAPAAAVTSVKPPPLQPTPVASAAPAPPTPRPPVQAQPNVTTPMKTQPQTPQPQTHVTPTTAEPQPQTPQPQHQQSKEIVVRSPEPPVDMAGGCGGASPSRWPKAEVHALIQLRTEMETRYQDTAPKGPLWEDISVGMRRLGYNRSSKRCKEKWENINKYFKKVKESSRKRPEDSKTCPYFHQLDALYRTKALASSSGVHASAPVPASSPRAEPAAVTVLAPVPLSSQTPPAAQHVEHGAKNFANGSGNGNGNGSAMQVKPSNGAPAAAMFPSPVQAAGNVGNNGTATNKLESKQEGIAKETAAVQPAVAMNHSYGRNDRRDVYDLDSDSMDDDEEDDDFDDDDDEDDHAVGGGRNINMPPVQYDNHFLQRQHQQQQHNHGHSVVRPNATNGSSNPPAGNTAPTSTTATSGTPFLAMVQ